MNISQPVSASLESVEFTFLSVSEIHAISAQRIENEQTFDSLNNPVPGGLYDPALGSWGDSICTTCNLGQGLCPGHPGHIDLPVPVYHPVFMDQMFRLLRAQCASCHRFRLSRKVIHRYVCMLRLLQHGLLAEAGMIDAMDETDLGRDLQKLALADVPMLEMDAAGDKTNNTQDSTMRARQIYVEQALRQAQARNEARVPETKEEKHEGATALRRSLVKDFLSLIVKDKKCATCSAISPVYRKDRWVKIFERDLSAKEKTKMAAAGRKRADAILQKYRKNGGGAHELDEGVADVNLTWDDSGADGTTESEGAGEGLDETGDVVERPQAGGDKKQPAASAPGQRYLSSPEVMARLSLLLEAEQDILSLIYQSRPQKISRPLTADMFFLQTLLVPPNRYRPEARTDNLVAEAQQNNLYRMILKSSAEVALISRQMHSSRAGARDQPTWGPDRRPGDTMAAFHQACTVLQDKVNSLIDKSKNPVQGAAAKRNEDGIKQKLEKKLGLFRANMMGKRVNFAARSVISPDPNIETNEIGVPPVFATKLTYPEPVTSHNFKDMQRAVINGVNKWPGAAAVETETGQVVNLRNKSVEDRVSLANQLLAPSSSSMAAPLLGRDSSGSGVMTRNKKVHRHIFNGDLVLMNRQPTLHKPSIMGHRVRVLLGEKTIRMHYANCNTYNADFDGDEMNMHFPQNEIARAEALQIADTDHQYISATAGEPLRGLIQDHLSISVALCNKDSFLDRGTYQQLIYGALRPESGHITGEKIELVRPAVLKPVVRWTGKQVITTILRNIRPLDCGKLWMNSQTKIKGDRWGPGGLEESTVMFRDGELVTGILDKSQLGPSSGGFVHAVHEVYGPAAAGKLLSSLGRLLTRFLNMRAFTCGMDDLKMTAEGEATRRQKLREADRVGLEVAARYVSLQDQQPSRDDPELLARLEEVMRDDKKQEGLDLLMTAGCQRLSSDVTAACLPAGLEKQFPKNQMQAMTTSGAKGGPVNANLISCNLGQQVLEGRRVPLMVSGKSLPCFRPFDTDVRAGGYVVNRFLTGIRPQEYFFHLMAGREGLIDTAVKTSRSGYLQRCIIKGMEGLRVAYDMSVRDADGTICQFLYGEDGLDITKQRYLRDFTFQLQNRTSELVQIQYSDEAAETLLENKNAVIKQMKAAIKSARAAPGSDPIDPVLSVLDPSRFAFATSESFYRAMTEYTRANHDCLIKEKGASDRKGGAGRVVTKKNAEKLFSLKYLRSLVEPGEAVGIVAGQSIGEPSTQMTLNTFHLAGHSARNVTLGIPRLREILMTASAKISTPTMTMALNEELSEADGHRFSKSISVLSLSHVLNSVTVREQVGKGVGQPRAKLFKIRLRFFPSCEYAQAYAIQVADVLDTVERKFLPALESVIIKAVKRATKQNSDAVPVVGVEGRAAPAAASRAGGDGRQKAESNDDDEGGDADDDEDDDDDNDDDETSARQRSRRTEDVSYGPNDGDDDRIQKQMEADAADHETGEEVEEWDDDDDEAYGGSPPSWPQNGQAAVVGTEDERAKANNRFLTQYKVDKAGGEWCKIALEMDTATPKILMIMLVQEAIKKSVIQQIAGVRTCTYVAEEKVRDCATGQIVVRPVVHTEGANLRAMQQYGDYINPNRIMTNDIAAVLDLYGVEACRANIIRELSGVFGGHGISVDMRHLNLIADYMTRNGGYTPFNRIGLSGNTSPFTKMSFETTLSFLKDAVLDGDWDSLNTPSSRLVVGQLAKFGTGSFDVLTRVPMNHFDAAVGA